MVKTQETTERKVFEYLMEIRLRCRGAIKKINNEDYGGSRGEFLRAGITYIDFVKTVVPAISAEIPKEAIRAYRTQMENTLDATRDYLVERRVRI